jgi:hypothetical protein
LHSCAPTTTRWCCRLRCSAGQGGGVRWRCELCGDGWLEGNVNQLGCQMLALVLPQLPVTGPMPHSKLPSVRHCHRTASCWHANLVQPAHQGLTASSPAATAAALAQGAAGRSQHSRWQPAQTAGAAAPARVSDHHQHQGPVTLMVNTERCSQPSRGCLTPSLHHACAFPAVLAMLENTA